MLRLGDGCSRQRVGRCPNIRYGYELSLRRGLRAAWHVVEAHADVSRMPFPVSVYGPQGFMSPQQLCIVFDVHVLLSFLEEDS